MNAKGLTMSFDDGTIYDTRLVEILNRYELTATFYLSAGRQGGEWLDLEPDLYLGHEVGNHTFTHAHLRDVDNVKQEIEQNTEELKKIFGYRPVSFAYPFGEYDRKVIEVIKTIPYIKCCRTIVESGSFQHPKSYLRWHPTCHIARAYEIGEKFLREDGASILNVWGHSYEFEGIMSQDKTKDWEYFEEFCKLMVGANVMCATNAQLCAI